MDKAKILDKIKKCLALSKSANEHEAALALKHAQALMQEYGLSLDDVVMSDVAEYGVKAPQTLPSWHWQLVHICGLAFGCEHWLVSGWGGGKMVFAGLHGRPELAAYAYEVLLRQLKQARRAFIKNELSRVRLAKNKTYRADQFCAGWVDTVRATVKAFARTDAEKALMKSYMENHHGGMREAKARDMKPTSHARTAGGDARDAGSRAAGGVTLNTPISMAKTKQLTATGGAV